jgi:dihydropteroate synthase
VTLAGDRHELAVRGRVFMWGARTYVMGILNLTPDSFSGDGLLAADDPAAAAAAQARRMADEGADLLDLGAESTRPGHVRVEPAEELRRLLPALRAVRSALPEMPLSVDTTRPEVGAAAIDAGADLLNDVRGTTPDDGMTRLAALRGVPLILMHSRPEAAYRDVVAEVVDELHRAVERAVARGCARGSLIVDPGIGFGKTPFHNLALLRDLDRLADLGLPILLGASRKSTIGRVLDLPPDERLEGTLALTALAIRSGVDIVRVHDVGPNVRAARMADAVVRGWEPPPEMP